MTGSDAVGASETGAEDGCAVKRHRPRLMAITDSTGLEAGELVRRLEPVLARAQPGSVIVQLREPALDDRACAELGWALRSVTRRHGQFLSVNDRIHLALLLDADALHLGERSVTPLDARRLWGTRFISRACHAVEDVCSEGVDAILLSPIVAARKGRPALGVAALADARRALREMRAAPLLYALGGIDAASARSCLDAGADGIAAIGAAMHPREAVRLLEELFAT